MSGGLELTRLFDDNNAEYPLCRIRAGDVLQVVDLIPTSVGITTPDLDALRTFYVRETRCDHRTGTVTVFPDHEDLSLPRLLAQARGLRRPV